MIHSFKNVILFKKNRLCPSLAQVYLQLCINQTNLMYGNVEICKQVTR